MTNREKAQAGGEAATAALTEGSSPGAGEALLEEVVRATAAPPPPSRRELRELAERARKGEPGALARLVRATAGRPDELVRLGQGDLAGQAQMLLTWLQCKGKDGNDHVKWAAIDARTAQLRAELAGPAPTPVVRLLAERAALCWLECHAADIRAIAEAERGTSIAAIEFRDRQRDRAQARYLAALRALDRARRPSTPMIQVNVAEDQVNVAGR